MVSLELVFEISSELLHADSEQILHEVASQTDALVGVVVLVVRVSAGDGHLEHLSHDAPQEDCFLLTVLHRGS